MAILDIVKLPDPRLREKALEVKSFDSALKSFVENMGETMYQAAGIGLASTQVADKRRVLVIDIAGMEERRSKKNPVSSDQEVDEHQEKKSGTRIKKLECFINPVILEREGEIEYEEGCLSIPGVYATVERSEFLRVRYQDLSGALHEIETHGLRSIVLQHEIDHLDGILFPDRIGPMQRMLLLENYRKLRDKAAREGLKK